MGASLNQMLKSLHELDGNELRLLIISTWGSFLNKGSEQDVEVTLHLLNDEVAQRGIRDSVVDNRPELVDAVLTEAKELLCDDERGLSQADRVLVAGFILSEDSLGKDFTARSVNDLLERLGSGRIANVTAALSALESRRFLEVTEKVGEFAQAQKRHCLTAQGHRRATLLLAMKRSA